MQILILSKDGDTSAACNYHEGSSKFAPRRKLQGIVQSLILSRYGDTGPACIHHKDSSKLAARENFMHSAKFNSEHRQ